MLAATSWLLLTMGCAEYQARCTFDSECSREARCVQGSCYQECLSDEECDASGEGNSCMTLDRGPDASQQFSICAPPDFTEIDTRANAATRTCEEDQPCQELFRDARARCGILSTCIIPPEEHAILITVRHDEGSRPVELVSAHVEDEHGVRLGSLMIDVYRSGQSEHQSDDAPDKWNQEPPLTCPAPAQSLILDGQESLARLGLVTPSGRLLLEEGWRVVLVERADVCTDPDGILAADVEISLCVGLAGDAFSPEEQCTRTLATMQREEPTMGGLEAIISFGGVSKGGM